jgi:Flp pilus assembly protein TadG
MFSFIHKNCRCLLSWSRGFPRRDAAAAAIRVGVAARFMRDQSGAYAVMFGLAAPIVIGALALGSETGLWYSTQARIQGAADSAAISAAIGVVAGDTNWTLEADATAASNGYLNGSNGTVVTVNNPPKSGPNAGTAGDIEVIIKQPQKLLFSGLFLKSPVVVQARAVGGPNPQVTCVLALSQTPLVSLVTGLAAAAFANVLADQCTVADNSPGLLALTVALFSSITAQKVKVVGGFLGLLGTVTPSPVNAPATPDPFAGTTIPPISSCDHTNLVITGPVALSPGVYCGGLTVNGGGNATLSPGTYYMDVGRGLVGGSGFSVVLGGQVTGTGVTIVQTSSTLINLPGLSLLGTVNLTAPSSGPYAGLVIFDDLPALLGVLPGPNLAFALSPSVNLIGTIYAPHSVVSYAVNGGTTHTGQCTRLIADTIIFALGGTSFSKCAVTLGPSAAAPASLLE